jgi:hypothetical protein
MMDAIDIARRSLLQSMAAAASVWPIMESMSAAQAQSIAAGRKLLLKGGYVVSGDKTVGELKVGDVLINGSRIEAVGSICRTRTPT